MADVPFCSLSDKHATIQTGVKYSGFQANIRKWAKRIGKTGRYCRQQVGS
jgi:hypothetical protein